MGSFFLPPIAPSTLFFFGTFVGFVVSGGGGVMERWREAGCGDLDFRDGDFNLLNENSLGSGLVEGGVGDLRINLVGSAKDDILGASEFFVLGKSRSSSSVFGC